MTSQNNIYKCFGDFEQELQPLLAPFLPKKHVEDILHWLYKLDIKPFCYPNLITIPDPAARDAYQQSLDAVLLKDITKLQGFEKTPIGTVDLIAQLSQVRLFGTEQAYRLLGADRYITHRTHGIYIIVHQIRNNRMVEYYCWLLWLIYYMDAGIKSARQADTRIDDSSLDNVFMDGYEKMLAAHLKANPLKANPAMLREYASYLKKASETKCDLRVTYDSNSDASFKRTVGAFKKTLIDLRACSCCNNKKTIELLLQQEQ